MHWMIRYGLGFVALGLWVSVGMAAGNKDLAEKTCTTCHNLKRVQAKFGQDRGAWETLVGRMLAKNGAPKLSDAERQAIIEWWAAQKP
jgi:cytochrome c5